jgi:predicted metalloprotease with PDZ domain
MTMPSLFLKRIRAVSIASILVLLATIAFSRQPAGTVAFTLSMEQPNSHLYHVNLRCDGIAKGTQDFKLPAWTPGFYGILDYAKNVRNFQVQDETGEILPWEKTNANTWRVATGLHSSVSVSYDVLANNPFVANSYLDENRGYIMPAGLFMHPVRQVSRPITLTIQLNPAWKSIATGLDQAKSGKHAYIAPDFDVLYDSPILMGNLDTLPSFEIQGVPHTFYGFNVGTFDRNQFMSDLKACLEAGIAVIGEIPYKQYTFLAIGPGPGGIEHMNSTSFGFSSKGLDTRAGRNRMLSFLSHEYFHHYNVKRIRPIAFGPFDYDVPNLTTMLWVSEGFTVYYEYLMLARAGLMTQDEMLDALRRNIAAYENSTGHLFQSATQSSYDSWSQGPFGRRGTGVVRTISYYDKGPVLGMLLDFKIRHEAGNRKSLDDVMRTLYRKYYKDQQRGFTDQEFREVCETTAGVSLDELFDYAGTTHDIDYPKYLAYAGLEIEKPKELPAASSGIIVEDKVGSLVVATLDRDSSIKDSTICAQDTIKSLDGARVDAKAFGETIASRKPGDTVRLIISRTGIDRAVDLRLGHAYERTFRMTPIEHPDSLQSAILKSWTKM